MTTLFAQTGFAREAEDPRTEAAKADSGSAPIASPPRRERAKRTKRRLPTVHQESRVNDEETDNESTRLPDRNETGKVVGLPGLHGEAHIEAATQSMGAEERVVTPLPSVTARGAYDAGASPPDVVASATPATRDAGAEKQSIQDGGTAKADSPIQPAPRAAPVPKPAPTPRADNYAPLDLSVLDQIRIEIRSRLPYFQACAKSALRRTGVEIRRVQATWFILADGTIKEVKVEGVTDPQLATCIARVGSRPFSVQPGQDLTIPTPIVFVR